MGPYELLLGRMLGAREAGQDGPLPLLDPARWLDRPVESSAEAAAALNAAFMVAMCGTGHPASARGRALLDDPPPAAPAALADFYRRGLALAKRELEAKLATEPEVAAGLQAALDDTVEGNDPAGLPEALWGVFFPEGVGILGSREDRVAQLRRRRTIRISDLAAQPISDPASEVLFTSNVLLTVPATGSDPGQLPHLAGMHDELRRASGERQEHWYDHPIQIGVQPANNELLYGLHALDEAAAFERRRGNLSGRLRVALSVSVTHHRLRGVAHDYVREELRRAGGLANLDVFVLTEDETGRLLEQVLIPAAGEEARDTLPLVFGVDGEYGRHYSFLKAIAALWAVLVDERIRATFKFDLDQVFPQDVLVAETGRSALEHLATPLWGAAGIDAGGRPVELGMIAGALVNERDIGRGLFTPDVAFPDGPSAPDEYVFFSRLPQALSTRAEMMERYDTAAPDGRRSCLERIHVTGGTNGILVDALRRHRPFTPTFIGRAEDQAYILSVLDADGAGQGPRLAYAHAAGLIMRHDKEAFAAEAIEAARVGKLVGDDVRIVFFSAYAGLLGRERIKALTDPFTGCFISRLPATVVMLRFALRVAHAFERGDDALGLDLAETGAPRIGRALDFVAAGLPERMALERRGWTAYYDALDRLESGLREGQPHAVELRAIAQRLIVQTRVS